MRNERSREREKGVAPREALKEVQVQSARTGTDELFQIVIPRRQTRLIGLLRAN